MFDQLFLNDAGGGGSHIAEIPQSRRHFHTGYGIFHCDLMKYDIMLHTICRFPYVWKCLTYGTAQSLSFRVLFTNFGISGARRSGGFHYRRRRKLYINWLYFEQIMVRNTRFEQNRVFFVWNWYIGGELMATKIGVAKVKISTPNSGNIHSKFSKNLSPSPQCLKLSALLRCVFAFAINAT